MKIVELILNEEELSQGINAVSVVHSPAIESNFIALNNHQVKFASVDGEKRILLGAILIPDKPIYRDQVLNGQVEQFYCYFSKNTVEKASQLYLMKGNHHNTTLEHELALKGLCMVESWIKVDMTNDKSAAYGLNDPIGTWYGAFKVNNDEIWNDFVKTGKVKGFSIEGFFADKSLPTQMSKVENDIENRIKRAIEILKEAK
jgi:hypothetical protein